MNDSFKSELKQMLDQSVSLDLIQQKCQKVLSSTFENFDFTDSKLKHAILELCNHEIFPIKYRINNENVAPIVPKTKAIVIYGILGLIGISTSLYSNRTDNIFLDTLGGLVTLASGIGVGYYCAKRKTSMQPHTYLTIVSTVDEMSEMIDSAHKSILKLAELVPTEVDSEILQWFQKLYAKSCRDSDKKNLKEDIEDLMFRLGYEFVYYTPNDIDYFDASNANITEVYTTVPAVRNSVTNKVVLSGRVVFPL